jgi:hypothetical protein
MGAAVAGSREDRLLQNACRAAQHADADRTRVRSRPRARRASVKGWSCRRAAVPPRRGRSAVRRPSLIRSPLTRHQGAGTRKDRSDLVGGLSANQQLTIRCDDFRVGGLSDRSWRELFRSHSWTLTWHVQSRVVFERITEARLQVRAEGQETATAIPHYKLTRAARHVGKSARELHASSCILNIQSARAHRLSSFVSRHSRIFDNHGPRIRQPARRSSKRSAHGHVQEREDVLVERPRISRRKTGR